MDTEQIRQEMTQQCLLKKKCAPAARSAHFRSSKPRAAGTARSRSEDIH